MKLRGKFFITIIIIACRSGLPALDYFVVDGGLTFIGNADIVSAVNPIIPGCGFSLPFFFTKYLYIKTGIFLSGTNYLYNGSRPVPAGEENREYLVLMQEADCFFGFKLPITGSLEWGVNTGIALLLRFPVALFASGGVNYNSAASWFFSDLRFLYPAAELFLKWNIEENFGIIFGGKSLVPLFHLWDNDGLPFWDQLVITGTAGFFFKFPAVKP